MNHIDCTICGGDIFEGKEAGGLTWGRNDDGFRADSEPWEEVMCPKCMAKVQEAIAKIKKES